MGAVYVSIPPRARDALVRLAHRELRDPRDQAAWLVLDGLRRAGVLDEGAADGTPQQPKPSVFGVDPVDGVDRVEE